MPHHRLARAFGPQGTMPAGPLDQQNLYFRKVPDAGDTIVLQIERLARNILLH